MVKYARLVWETEIPDNPTKQDMEDALDGLLNKIESYVRQTNAGDRDIDDIEICDRHYEIKGKGFFEFKFES